MCSVYHANMKQDADELFFAFPKKLPKTVGGLSNWNKKLLDDCLFLEFKKRAINAALESVDQEFKEYVSYVRDEGPVGLAARKATGALNRLRIELREELAAIKLAVRIVHDTNELIIGSIVKSAVGPEVLEQVLHTPHPESNLLHGHGWLFEFASGETMRGKGYAPFVTFGTVFDASKVDVIAVSKPNSRVKWNLSGLRGLRCASRRRR